MGVEREQGDRLESSINTRQDRNTFLTGGGTLTWEGSTGTLTWTADLLLYIGTLAAPVTISAGSIAGVTPEPTCIYVLVNRATGGSVSMASASVHAAVLDKDNAIVLAVRGPNSRLHFCDGTVLNDGASGSLGAPSPGIGQSVVDGDGGASYLVGFDYLEGTNQLMVVVGGLVQQLGLHYTETAGSPGEVEFQAGYEPGATEKIVFLGLNGGQGPPGPNASRQDAYTSGRTVATTSGQPLQNQNATPTEVLEQWGTPGDSDAAYVRADGKMGMSAARVSDSSSPGDYWEQISLGGDLVFWNSDTGAAVRVDRDTGGYEPGTCDGSTFTPAEDGSVAMAYVEIGALDSVGPTTLSWTRGCKGLLVLAFNDTPVIQAWSAVEQSGLSSAGNELYAFYDSTIPAILLSGDLAGAQPVGANYRGNACRLIVFY